MTRCETCGLAVDPDDETVVSVKDGADWENSRIYWHAQCFGSPPRPFVRREAPPQLPLEAT